MKARWALGLGAGLFAAALLAGPWWLRLSCAVAAAALLVYLFAASSGWLFGPVLRYELVQRARSPRVAVLRVGYGLVLLLALFLVYLGYVPGTAQERLLAALTEGARVDPKDGAAFAASFFHVFVLIQFLVLLLFTPALVGGSIATERRRGTLDLLFATDLSNREIVLGKLGSQLAYLLLLLLTGLPILCFLQLLGGIEPELVLVTFIGTLASLVTLGAASMLSAVLFSRTLSALKAAYMFGLVHALISAAWYAVLTTIPGSREWILYGALAVYVVYNAFVSVTALRDAVRRLRVGPLEIERPEIPSAPEEPVRRERRRDSGPSHHRYRTILADRDPMLWKEVHYKRSPGEFMGGGREQVVPLVLFGLVLAATGYGVAHLFAFLMPYSSGNVSAHWNWLTIVVGVPCLQVLLLLLALRAALAFSRDHEAGTYEGLLATTLTDREIFRAKWVASLWGGRLWLIAAGGGYVAGLCVGGVSPESFVLAAAALAVHLAFVINVGLYCSAGSSSTLRATTATLALLVLLVGGHWLIALITQPVADSLWGREAADIVYDVHLRGLTLPWNLAALSFSEDDTLSPHFGTSRLLPGLTGLAYYGGLALLLRWGVHRRMRRSRLA